jgi:hypothetical protein
MTIVAGAAVGVLGVEGWGGFIAYIISQLLVSIKLQAHREVLKHQHMQAADVGTFSWIPCVATVSCFADQVTGTCMYSNLNWHPHVQQPDVCVCLRVWPHCAAAVVQCTLPILAKCGGNYEKYLATW